MSHVCSPQHTCTTQWPLTCSPILWVGSGPPLSPASSSSSSPTCLRAQMVQHNTVAFRAGTHNVNTALHNEWEHQPGLLNHWVFEERLDKILHIQQADTSLTLVCVYNRQIPLSLMCVCQQAGTSLTHVCVSTGRYLSHSCVCITGRYLSHSCVCVQQADI